MKKPGRLTPAEVTALEQELPVAPSGLPESFTERWNTLTMREKAAMQAKCQNKTGKEIGEVLFITDQTVKNILTSVYRKLGVDRHVGNDGKSGGGASNFVCWQLGVITGIRIGRDGTVEPMARPKPKRSKPHYSVEH